MRTCKVCQNAVEQQPEPVEGHVTDLAFTIPTPAGFAAYAERYLNR